MYKLISRIKCFHIDHVKWLLMFENWFKITKIKDHDKMVLFFQLCLCNILVGQQFTWDNSSMNVNKPKNRYANVIAYDHSRVVLQPVDGVPGSDYINANYCDGYRKQNGYIATQVSDSTSIIVYQGFRLDLGKSSKMMIFTLLFTTFEVSIIFRSGSLAKILKLSKSLRAIICLDNIDDYEFTCNKETNLSKHALNQTVFVPISPLQKIPLCTKSNL